MNRMRAELSSGAGEVVHVQARAGLLVPVHAASREKRGLQPGASGSVCGVCDPGECVVSDPGSAVAGAGADKRRDAVSGGAAGEEE